MIPKYKKEAIIRCNCWPSPPGGGIVSDLLITCNLFAYILSLQGDILHWVLFLPCLQCGPFDLTLTNCSDTLRKEQCISELKLISPYFLKHIFFQLILTLRGNTVCFTIQFCCRQTEHETRVAGHRVQQFLISEFDLKFMLILLRYVSVCYEHEPRIF